MSKEEEGQSEELRTYLNLITPSAEPYKPFVALPLQMSDIETSAALIRQILNRIASELELLNSMT